MDQKIYKVTVRDRRGMEKKIVGIAKNVTEADAKAVRVAKDWGYDKPYAVEVTFVGETEF